MFSILTKKFDIEMSALPVSCYEIGNKIRLTMSIKIDGQNTRKFVNDLKTDKRVVNLEMTSSDFGLIEIEIKSDFREIYRPEIFYLKPLLIQKNGEKLWEVASFDKKVLTRVVESIDKCNTKFKIVKFKQEKMKDVFRYSFNPNLTEHQKNALNLAISQGYYAYPRKTNIQKLAKKSGVSSSTFLFHLRKAEQKMFPSITGMTK